MDAEKMLGAVRGMPPSALAGLGLAALAASVWPPLQAAVPASARGPLPLIAVALLAMAALGLVSLAVKAIHAERGARRADAQQRLEHLYAPMVALFLRRHVTSCTGICAPRFRHRLANAREELIRYRRWRTGLRRAWRALGDRQVSTSAEVEYGGDFPLAEIHDCVVAHPALAGAGLMNLVRRADRSRYEDGSVPGLMTDEELALFLHIQSEHDRLTRLAA